MPLLLILKNSVHLLRGQRAGNKDIMHAADPFTQPGVEILR